MIPGHPQSLLKRSSGSHPTRLPYIFSPRGESISALINREVEKAPKGELVARYRGREGLDDESGCWLVALRLQVPFEIFAPDLYVAPELNGGYLPTLYTPVDPRFAHPQLLADVRDREEIEVPSCSWLGLGTLLPLFWLAEGIFELYEGAL